MDINKLPTIIVTIIIISFIIGASIISIGFLSDNAGNSVLITENFTWVDSSNITLSHSNIKTFVGVYKTPGNYTNTSLYSVDKPNGILVIT